MLKKIILLGDFILIEGDGSKNLPLKAPKDNEPVIIKETNLVIGIMGFDSINKKIKDIYNDREVKKKDIEHLISMFFPDVRLKNYVEIRMADCTPIYYALSYAAIIKGIFYSDSAVNILLDKFRDVKNIDVKNAKLSIIEKGYDGVVYGENPRDIILNIIDLARENLEEDEKDRVKLLYDLAKSKMTLKQKEGNIYESK